MARRLNPRSCATHSILVSFAVAGLAACGSGSDPKAPNYSIRATVTGLTEGNSVVLQVADGSKPTTVGQNGVVDLLFVPAGTKYHVTVKTPPASPPETCTISHGEGTVGTSDVTDVLVTCSEKTFNIAVSVTGLAGSGLAICDKQIDLNCTNSVPITAIGPTALRSAVANTAPFLLTFTGNGQPISPWQTCVFDGAGGDGTTAGGSVQGADVTVSVTCTTNKYSIAGTITGLTGTGLKLSVAGQEDVTLAAGAKSFAFANQVDSGSSYAISITGQPTSPWQTCVVASGAGTVGGQDTNAMVTCTTNQYTVGGAVSQLRSNLVLTVVNESDQTSQDVTLSSGTAPFQFTKKLASGSRYHLAVKTQPASPKQLCSVTQGTGVVGNADINAAVTCQTYHQISGRVLGYQGTGLTVTLSGTSPGFTPLTSSADTSGNYVFSDVLDGTYTITPSASPSCWAMSPQSIGVAPVWNGVDSTGNNFTATLSPSVTSWCPMATMPTASSFTAVSGSSAVDVWVLSPRFTLSNWNGTSWTSATTGTDGVSYDGLLVNSHSDLWFYGAGTIDHWDGSRLLLAEKFSVNWFGVWGAGQSTWFVGSAGGPSGPVGFVRSYTGNTFSGSVDICASPKGVWGSSASDVWAVGLGACHLTNGSWAVVSSGTTNQLRSIWGSASNDIWAVGAAGTIVRWNGSLWSPSTYSGVVTTKDLNQIWGSGANDVWAVGAGGTILHWNGSAWTNVASGTAADLTGVWGSGSKDVWAVGGNAILRWQDQ